VTKDDIKQARAAGSASPVLGPGYTPSRRDVVPLLARLADASDEDAEAIERALALRGEEIVAAVRDALPAARGRLRGRLVRLLGRLFGAAGEAGAALDTLLDAAFDADPKARRNAVIALGRARGDVASAAEDVLLRALAEAPDAPLLRSIVASLGKVGGPRAADALARLDADARDAELVRVLSRAKLMLARTHAREEPSRIRDEVMPDAALALRLSVREGLEPLLIAELTEIEPRSKPRLDRPGVVAALWKRPLRDLFAARLFVDVAIALKARESRVPDASGLADAVADAIASEATVAQLRRFTEGPLRFRLAFQSGGHRRALVWDVAAKVAAKQNDLRNDPTNSPWEIVVDETPSGLRLELVPRGLEDRRFAYREGDVPAASHPTVAAALVRLGGVRADDVVWDPFCGSGTELIERAKRGAHRALLGTDRDARAIEVARVNAARAGVEHVMFEPADALTYDARGVTLIVTNPPLGRRVLRDEHATDVLERFVARAARVLVPGGRMAWVNPSPRRIDPAAQKAGLVLAQSVSFDMGGFPAHLQLLEKPGILARHEPGHPRGDRDRRRP
jgi:23S rRNA G2445 N2-methylase RlmL